MWSIPEDNDTAKLRLLHVKVLQRDDVEYFQHVHRLAVCNFGPGVGWIYLSLL